MMGKPIGHSQDRRLRPARPRRHRPAAACRRRAARRRCPTTTRTSADPARLPADQEDDRRRATPAARARAASTAWTRTRGGRRSRRRSISRPAQYRPKQEAAARQRRGRPKRACARWSSIPTRAGAMPGACCRRPSPTPPRWCPRSPTTSSRSMTRHAARLCLEMGAVRAASTGSAPPGSPRSSTAEGTHGAAAAGRRPRAGSFYRDRGRQAAASRRPTGDYRDVAARRGRAAARRRQARVASRSRKNGSASLWDVGDGVALPRVPQQDERARRRQSSRMLTQGDRLIVPKALQGAGDLQRGRQLLGRRQYRPRAVRRQYRACGR